VCQLCNKSIQSNWPDQLSKLSSKNTCADGKYNDAEIYYHKYTRNNLPQCANCAINQYKAIGQISCQNCAANSISPAGSTTSGSCIPQGCPAGYSSINSASCTPCDAGKYKTATDFSSCVDCGLNSNSPQASTVLSACTCNAGYIGEPGSFCTVCLSGKYKYFSS